jgi:hypothetical protein
LRPVRSYTLMLHLLLETADRVHRAWVMRRRSQCHEIWTVVKTFLDSCQVSSGPGRDAGIQLVRTRTVRVPES